MEQDIGGKGLVEVCAVARGDIPAKAQSGVRQVSAAGAAAERSSPQPSCGEAGRRQWAQCGGCGRLALRFLPLPACFTLRWWYVRVNMY